jgi:hypothetical protein
MPDASQMPQQIMLPSERHGDIVLDVLGVRVPASMLESGYFLGVYGGMRRNHSGRGLAEIPFGC